MSGSGPARELNRTQKVEAAYQNEYLTRQRVVDLEHKVKALNQQMWAYDVAPGKTRPLSVIEQLGILHRGFWGRLRWLLLGR
jgi:hypothetical protein